MVTPYNVRKIIQLLCFYTDFDTIITQNNKRQNTNKNRDSNLSISWHAPLIAYLFPEPALRFGQLAKFILTNWDFAHLTLLVSSIFFIETWTSRITLS